MKVGSVVKLSRPYSGNEIYRDVIGIVTYIYQSQLTNDMLCKIRFLHENYTHLYIDVYQNRLDVLVE